MAFSVSWIGRRAREKSTSLQVHVCWRNYGLLWWHWERLVLAVPFPGLHERANGDGGGERSIYFDPCCDWLLKSLFDHLHRVGIPKAPSEKRLAIDLAGLRQTMMREAGLRPMVLGLRPRVNHLYTGCRPICSWQTSWRRRWIPAIGGTWSAVGLSIFLSEELSHQLFDLRIWEQCECTACLFCMTCQKRWHATFRLIERPFRHKGPSAIRKRCSAPCSCKHLFELWLYL